MPRDIERPEGSLSLATTGICAEDARRHQRGRQLRAFAQKQVDLVGGNLHVVTLVERHAVGGCADNTDRIARNKNVGVGRLAAAVDDDVVDAVTENQQRSLGRKHIYRYPGLERHEVAPDAGGINRHVAAGFESLAGVVVEQFDPLDAVARDDEVGDLVIGQNVGAVAPGVDNVGCGQAEGVDGSVGNGDSPDQVGIDARLDAARLLRVDGTGVDAGRTAALDKFLLIVEVIFGKGYEKTAGVFDTVARYAAQYHVLLDTFTGALLVGDGITRSAVEQAVVSAGGACGEVKPLDQQNLKAAHGAVTGRSGARGAAADDYHIIVFVKFIHGG